MLSKDEKKLERLSPSQRPRQGIVVLQLKNQILWGLTYSRTESRLAALCLFFLGVEFIAHRRGRVNNNIVHNKF